jgi:hypothetical protein
MARIVARDSQPGISQRMLASCKGIYDVPCEAIVVLYFFDGALYGRGSI